MKFSCVIGALLIVSLGLCVAQLGLEAEWIRVGSPAASEKISMFVALRQKNVEILEAKALAVSDPDSPEYGHFLSLNEIQNLVSPSKKDHDIVFNYFAQKGCQVHTFSDSLSVECSVAIVEQMFDTEFVVYKHENEDARLIRHMKAYSIPQEILGRIELLTTAEGQCRICNRDTKSAFDRSKVFQNRCSNETSPFGYIHPAFLRKMYSFPDALFPAVSNMAGQIIGELGGVGFPYYSDLENFANLTNTEYSNFTNFPGGIGNPENAAIESTLDAEYIQAIGQGVETWYQYVNGWMLELVVSLNNMTDIPHVLSLSFGWEEYDQCDSQFTGTDCHGWTAAEYIKRTNVEFAKLVARGVSVIVASGDQGAAGELNNQCWRPAGQQLGSVFPATSPWVTTVSATTPIIQSGSYDIDLPPMCQTTNFTCLNEPVHEIPCMWNNTFYSWTTGGGFSIGTPMPAYQQAAVNKYLSLGPSNLPAPGLFNPKNRAYPDISSAGARFLYLVDDVVTVVEGTSASAPTVAAFVSLLNAYRFKQDKPALGFLNPLLYKLAASNPTIFNDITVGSNRCTVDGVCCPYGYDSTKGWDAVTGFGSIRFDKFFEVVKQL